MFAHTYPQRSRRHAFTLVELLMVIMLIGILATLVLVTLANVNEAAREDRTKAQVAKIHDAIMEKWQGYAYRRVPSVTPGIQKARLERVSAGPTQPKPKLTFPMLARDRLLALRDLMRLELPTSRLEVIGPDGSAPQRRLLNPLNPLNNSDRPWPALSRAYYQRALVATGASSARELMTRWTTDFESAECLYLILSQMRDEDTSVLQSFSESEIGDADGDGMPEIHDAWGNPILFLRWAPGYRSPLQKTLLEDPNQEDVFDPARLGTSYKSNYSNEFVRTLYPLIFSAGPDQKYGLQVGGDWFSTPVASDPHHASMQHVGAPLNAEDVEQSVDNITNHFLATR